MEKNTNKWDFEKRKSKTKTQVSQWVRLADL